MTKKEAIERIKDHIEIHKYQEQRCIKLVQAFDMACKALEESDRVGKWIYKKELNNFICNFCQKPSLEDDNFFYLTNYCPNCGILMEKRNFNEKEIS